ncbi:MAG: hypothetical protein AAGA90_07860 [Actinomycetota bacterium]
MTTTLTPEQHADRHQLEHDLAAAGHHNVTQRCDETPAEHHARLVSIDALARLRNPRHPDTTTRRVLIDAPDSSFHHTLGTDIGPVTCWCDRCEALVNVANSRRIRLPNGRVGNFHTNHLEYLETTP